MAEKYINNSEKVSDQEILDMAHWVYEHEGLFIGSSSALNLVATCRTAMALPVNSTLVTMICDSGYRHMSRFWNPEFINNHRYNDSNSPPPPPPPPSLSSLDSSLLSSVVTHNIDNDFAVNFMKTTTTTTTAATTTTTATTATNKNVKDAYEEVNTYLMWPEKGVIPTCLQNL